MNKNNRSFVMQAGILAMAGILCRIIGILYRSPLTGIIGDEGNGYYTTAYNLYAIILLISSYSIPSAISKVISARLAVNEFKNAVKIFKCAFIYVVIVGGTAALITWFGADFITGPASARVLRIFAPTIFLSGLLGVLRGFFQAHGTMVPTSVSQIIEQIVNAAMSIGMALLFISMNPMERAVAGASGSAFGTGSGVAAALVFMTIVYMVNLKTFREGVLKDDSTDTISTARAFGIIAAMVTPIVMSTFIYNFSTSLNQEIFAFIEGHDYGLSEAGIATEYGIFAGKAVVITNIPIALAAAMSSALIPAISASVASGRSEEVKKQISEAVKATMIIAIPAFVGMLVLSKPVMAFLFPQKDSLDEASKLLASISITVVLYGLSTVTNGTLQAVGKVMKPVVNAALALLIQTLVLVFLLTHTKLGVFSLAVSMIVYSGLMCFLNQLALRKVIGYRQEIKKTIVIPLAASGIMGVCALGVYTGAHKFIPSGRICLLIAMAAALMIYFILIIKLGGLKEEDLKHMPLGRTITGVLKKAGLLK